MTYLGCEAVSDKEAVFDLNGPDHVLGKLGFHLVHHLLFLHVLELHPVLGHALASRRWRLALSSNSHILLLYY